MCFASIWSSTWLQWGRGFKPNKAAVLLESNQGSMINSFWRSEKAPNQHSHVVIKVQPVSLAQILHPGEFIKWPCRVVLLKFQGHVGANLSGQRCALFERPSEEKHVWKKFRAISSLVFLVRLKKNFAS